MNVLWIDGIGGYAVWEQPRFEFGRAPTAKQGIPILGDLPSFSSVIRRAGDDWILEAVQPTRLNQAELARPTLINHGDRIEFGRKVEVVFERPNPCSSTAMLKLLSRHRWSESLDGVLLMGQTCLVGQSSKSHIRVRQAAADLLLYRSDDQWVARLNATTQYSTKSQLTETARTSSVPLTRGQRIQAGEFSLTLL